MSNVNVSNDTRARTIEYLKEQIKVNSQIAELTEERITALTQLADARIVCHTDTWPVQANNALVDAQNKLDWTDIRLAKINLETMKRNIAVMHEQLASVTSPLVGVTLNSR
jgi:hypothetical protein